MRTLPLMLVAALAATGCENRAPGVNPEGDTTTTAIPGGVATTGTITGTTVAPVNAPAAAVDPATYVATSASGDMYAIQSSQLALKTSKSADVRRFAERMITGHQGTTRALTQAVKGTGLALPTAMEDKHRQMLTQLETAARTGGATFDRLYLDQQRTAHAEAMDLHRSMSGRADLPGTLATFAAETFPKVSSHHSSLMQMGTGTGAAAGAIGTAGAPAS